MASKSHSSSSQIVAGQSIELATAYVLYSSAYFRHCDGFTASGAGQKEASAAADNDCSLKTSYKFSSIVSVVHALNEMSSNFLVPVRALLMTPASGRQAWQELVKAAGHIFITCWA